MHIIGAPFCTAISMTLHIFWLIVSESDPPFTVKSCALTYTNLPSIVALPTTTPSPRYCFFSIPKLWQRCSLNISYSSNESLSTSISIRSRAVYLPRWCCFSIAFSPPPRRACSRLAINSLIFSVCLLIIYISSLPFTNFLQRYKLARTKQKKCLFFFVLLVGSRNKMLIFVNKFNDDCCRILKQ